MKIVAEKTAVPIYQELQENHPDIQTLLDEFIRRHSRLEFLLPVLLEVLQKLVTCFTQNGTLFVCGNGGSYADALHITGELMKSFERKRPLPATDQEKLRELPFGEDLAQYLEVGLRAIPLGLNGSLNSALENDIPLRYMMFAQELYALGRPGDVLIGISTGGNAKNVIMAMSVARIKGIITIALTGENGGQMATVADLALRVPGNRTFQVQEEHIAVYHLLCAMVEAYWFKIKK